MIKAIRASVLAALAAVLFTPVSQAATYFVPTDAELIQKSDDIVVATGVTSLVERDELGAIVTRYTLRVEEALKGRYSPGAHLVLTERGGLLDGEIKYIPGTPEYLPGERYLVFTATNNKMEPATYGMALGQFFFEKKQERSLLLRAEVHGFDGNLGQHIERARDAAGFVEYIRGIVAQRVSPVETYFVDGVEAEHRLTNGKVGTLATRVSYLMTAGDGRGFRWQTPTASFVKAGTPVGPNGDAAVSQAFAEWNSTSSSINYSDGGQDNSANKGFTQDDGKNAILFNDPNNEVDSAAGIGGISSARTQYSVDGENFWGMFEVDVVMNNGSFAQNCYNSVMTHEVGHTLGFRHSDLQPAGGVTTSNAIMNSTVSCSWNGVLKTYDHDAASTVYGAGSPVCSAPAISVQPQDRTVAVGATTQLSVTASGSPTLSYQWFFGDSGVTTLPVPGATSSTLNVTPTSIGSGKYWVRVSNTCTSGPPANSRTATVTATCTNPAISAQSANVSISEGQSTQLSVTATGSALVYAWFEGAVGDVSKPRGANSSTLTVTPTATTSYWVNVTGLCGSPVRSSAFVVTVAPCAPLTIDAPTATPRSGAGNYALNVTANSSAAPITFSWFRGSTPGVGGTAVGTGQSLNVSVTATTTFWARVSNGCGRVGFSPTITVAPCTLPSITAQPADKEINAGQATQLSIGVSAGATVTWFRGTVGNTADPILTGATITTPPLAVTTQFWAQVSNTCGPVSSRQVTVTVVPIRELVPMLNGRFIVQVAYTNQFDNGRQGKLLGRSLSSTSISDTAIFTFGDPLVVELMVRLSDARPFENKVHLYLGGLSDVEFSVVVTDTLTGIIKEYRKPPNQLVGTIDRASFPGGTSLQDGVDALKNAKASLQVTPNAEVSTIRLLNNRFEVRMRYKNQFTNPAGLGFMNTRSIASSSTTETAVFFFDENVGSVEWMVRFSDARPFANRIDFFHGGLSDVEFTIEVLDTVTGARREYQKGPFSLAGQVDRDSFTP